MRLLAIVPFGLLAAACQVTEGNNSTTVSFNQDVAENAAADLGNAAEEAASEISNAAGEVAEDVRNVDVDVDVNTNGGEANANRQ